MAVPRLVRAVCVFGIAASAMGCHEAVEPSQGWGLRDLPDTPPSREAVLAAAAAVIAEAYPMSAVSQASGLVLAQTPVEMDGGSKTRKSISVRVTRNVTGAYEPEVRVRKLVDTANPTLAADPGTGNVSRASPVGTSSWQALDYLPYEEQAIHDAILARLEQSKGRVEKSAGEKGADVPADSRA